MDGRLAVIERKCLLVSFHRLIIDFTITDEPGSQRCVNPVALVLSQVDIHLNNAVTVWAYEFPIGEVGILLRLSPGLFAPNLFDGRCMRSASYKNCICHI